MTRRDFIEYKGWDKETAEKNIRGFWVFQSWWEHLELNISLYELWCDKPFCELNQEYNRVYAESNGEIGSTYDWLENTATDEDVEKYLRK